MYLFLIVLGDGSTDDYLGFERRNETAGSKRPQMYANMHEKRWLLSKKGLVQCPRLSPKKLEVTVV